MIIQKAKRKVKDIFIKEEIIMAVLVAAIAMATLYGLYRFDIWLQHG